MARQWWRRVVICASPVTTVVAIARPRVSPCARIWVIIIIVMIIVTVLATLVLWRWWIVVERLYVIIPRCGLSVLRPT